MLIHDGFLPIASFSYPRLLFDHILPVLFNGTLFSMGGAILFGLVVGVIVGAIKHRIKQTLLPACIGSFIGLMLIWILPILSMPSTVTIAGAGAYNGIVIYAMTLFLLPIGGMIGAVLGSTYGWRRLMHKRVLAIALALTYLIMIITMCISYTAACTPPSPYPLSCKELGFPDA